MIVKATTAVMTTATPWESVLPSALCSRSASAGAPSAPMPIEVIVTPICTADMYSLMFASWPSASPAPRCPSSRITSSRARRERTSAYSAITKNAFSAISTAVKRSFRPLTRGCYFEEELILRRRSLVATS